MPYRHVTENPTHEDLMHAFEAAIKSLVTRFREHPYAFYTETDMHCYLYHRLYSGGFANELYETADGHKTILLHKEYPTVSRYSRNPDRTITESEAGRRRGAFDMCLWDPDTVGRYTHRDQRILCAAELALNESAPACVHTLNDVTKLSGGTNGIKYPYLLYFIRDDTRYAEHVEAIHAALKDAATKVRVVVVRVDLKNAKDPKPKPEFAGPWGQP